MANRLTTRIIVALLLGLAVGWAVHTALADGTPAATAKLAAVAKYLGILTSLFLSLIRMIIAPLVFATLVVGIAHMDRGALGRVGARAFGWFVASSLVSLTLGMVIANVLKPGVGIGLPLPGNAAASGIDQSGFDLVKFVGHLVPTSVVKAMADNEIIQIVVFSVFLGVAVSELGERAAPLVRGTEALAAAMLRVTDYVMRLAPIAVFAAVAAALAEHGPAVLGGLAGFMGATYLGLALVWLLLAGAARVVLGSGVGQLFRLIRAPVLLAFTTASSEASFPRTLEALEAFGVPNRIASFVLPLGYSFNLVGSMIYMTLASLFIAQAYGIAMPLGTQVAMLLTLMVTSKGVAGVPRASLVVVTATLGQFGLPEAGILLILAVDHFIDMGRSATNVVGNAVAAAVVARWEGQLGVDEPAMLAGAEA